MSSNRVVLGMSGGVDSSVAAYILKEQGYEVIGVTMQIWPDSDSSRLEKEGGCCSLSAVDDARRVADHLGIPYYVLNFKDIFEKKVIDYFVDSYRIGQTPNPCIACNRYVKFEELLRRAEALGADYVATGHYAKVIYDTESDRYLLKKSASIQKDQTYALYNMNQYQLAHTLMPLGDYNNKDEIRRIARDIGLKVATKPDSQEICFVEDDDYGRFIEERAPGSGKPGNFVDKDENILGIHKGIIHYTVGQRKGLGITFGKPMYVVSINHKTNQVTLGEAKDVYSTSMIVEDLNLISLDRINEPMEVGVKIRYTAKEVPATILPIAEGRLKVEFHQPERAVTPGQAAVFYYGDTIVGGGTIISTYI